MTTYGLFDAGTGEVIPNLPTKPFAVIFEPTLKYQKVQAAIIVIRATDEETARRFADTWLRHGPMRNTVITAVVEIRPSEQPAVDAVAAIAAHPAAEPGDGEPRADPPGGKEQPGHRRLRWKEVNH